MSSIGLIIPKLSLTACQWFCPWVKRKLSCVVKWLTRIGKWQQHPDCASNFLISPCNFKQLTHLSFHKPEISPVKQYFNNYHIFTEFLPHCFTEWHDFNFYRYETKWQLKRLPKTVNHLKPKFRELINDSNLLLPPRTASLHIYWYFQNTVWYMPLWETLKEAIQTQWY